MNDQHALDGEVPMGRQLVLGGLFMMIVGFAWPYLGQLGLGRLPGDVVLRRPGYTLILPFATCALLSVTASLIFWVLGRLRS